MVSFNLAGISPSEVGLLLDQNWGILLCRVGLHCAPAAHRTIGIYPTGTVRFSWSSFNTPEEIDVSLAALAQIAEWQTTWEMADQNPSVSEYELEFARIWKKMPKIIFSKTLKQVQGNARLVRDNIAAEVTRLKVQPGMAMDFGGPNLAATFIRLGLVDEYRLFIQPVVLGSGTPFFPALDNPIKLELVETRTFGSGVVYLR